MSWVRGFVGRVGSWVQNVRGSVGSWVEFFLRGSNFFFTLVQFVFLGGSKFFLRGSNFFTWVHHESKFFFLRGDP